MIPRGLGWNKSLITPVLAHTRMKPDEAALINHFYSQAKKKILKKKKILRR